MTPLSPVQNQWVTTPQQSQKESFAEAIASTKNNNRNYCCPVNIFGGIKKIRVDTSHEVSPLLVIFVLLIVKITMSKDSHFTGQQ